jgi:mono/diheme cytochrome c family protein
MGRLEAAAGMLVLILSSATLKGEEETTAKIYATRCKPCHGQGGRAPNEDRNLADDRWIHGSSFADVVKVIEDGVPGKAMMPFKEQLTREEIEAMARYVLSFSKKTRAGK